MSPALARALARTESASAASALSPSPARGWVAAAVARLGATTDSEPQRDER